MRARFAFLIAGDTYETNLPDGADPNPDIYAAFLYGELPRPLIYEPQSRRTAPAADAGLIGLLEGRVNGSVVSVYRVREQPTAVVAFWRVAGGYIHTFMDDMAVFAPGCGEPDVTALLKTVVRAVSVSARPAGPFAAISDPLRPADPRDPLMREKVTFRIPGERGGSTLVFRREPGWAREGTSLQRDNAMSEVRVTTAAQVAVSAFGPTDEVGRLERYAETAAASLAPG